MTVPVAHTLLLTLLAATSGAVATGPPSSGPLDIDLEERVDVQYVLIDAVVHNGKEETVGALDAADFELLVDDKDVVIATLDVDCPLGGAPDPPVGASRAARPADAIEATRRYVFVMDYYHPGDPAIDVLGRMREAIERLHAPGEEFMLISLGQVLRIEVPFTDDPVEFARGIDRMVRDRGLYFGFYARLTEWRWFRQILTLLDLTERIPGQKSVVLFSGPFLADGWNYDEIYREIAAMAARSRTAFYPVDSRGLVVAGSILGPRRLSRLAVETGGRATAGTNDLARGFARAQRDQTCRYTVGFYDHRPRLDRERKVRLFVRRSGHRVSHPTYYVVRSEKKQRESLVRSAAMVPSMFPGDGLSSALLLIDPKSASRWNAVATLQIDPNVATAVPGDADWTVRGTLRRPNGTIHQKFERRFSMPAPTEQGNPAPVAVFAELQPRPGPYVLNVVVSNPAAGTPLATSIEVVVPEIP